jgi:hypothetical protein
MSPLAAPATVSVPIMAKAQRHKGSPQALWQELRRIAGENRTGVAASDRAVLSALNVGRRFGMAQYAMANIRETVIPDDAYPFGELAGAIEDAVRSYLVTAIGVATTAAEAERLAPWLAIIENAAFEVLDLADRALEGSNPPTAEKGLLGGPLDWRPGLMFAQEPVLQLGIAALAARREIEGEGDEAAGVDRLNPSPEAIRARRMRARRRRRVVLQIPFEIFTGDLELLRRLGFLSGADSSNPDAVAKAMEVFVLESFLSRGDAGPWRERLARQLPRLNTVRGDIDADE